MQHTFQNYAAQPGMHLLGADGKHLHHHVCRTVAISEAGGGEVELTQLREVDKALAGVQAVAAGS